MINHPMNRIDVCLDSLKRQGKKALVPYITAGDPSPEMTVPLMHALVEAGADMIELGMPFSDPMSEGLVIQNAMARALSFGITLPKIFDMVKTFRQQDNITPIILMGYLNPVFFYGIPNFAEMASMSGVDATLLVDLPPEERGLIVDEWSKHHLYSIYLCSPTTSEHRVHLISDLAQGYVYYVSLKGVTGSGDLNQILKQDYHRRKSEINWPLLVGFGIKTPQMAAEVAAFSDGVVVGAALISTIFDNFQQTSPKAGILAGHQFIRDMREAIDLGTL